MQQIIDFILGVLIIVTSLLGAANDLVNSSLDEKLTNEIENNISQKDIIYSQKEILDNDLKVVFCPDGCISLFQSSIKNSKNQIKCAFYELDNKIIADELVDSKYKGVNIELIVDDRYLDETHMSQIYRANIPVYSDKERNTRFNNYMHHKFCIFDSAIVITGSANPTDNGLLKNDNNILKLESTYLAKNFENEFDQMKAGIFGTNKISQLEYNNISLVYENETYIINTYFCPQDDCLTPILKELGNAQKEILFASFAFTNDDIASTLKMKDYQEINVSGVIETRSQNLKGSDYPSLKEEFNFVLDTNKNTMHHKFFVIDGKTVITGSMNPSASGVKYNDETLIIIENERVADLYREEFFNLIK